MSRNIPEVTDQNLRAELKSQYIKTTPTKKILKIETVNRIVNNT